MGNFVIILKRLVLRLQSLGKNHPIWYNRPTGVSKLSGSKSMVRMAHSIPIMTHHAAPGGANDPDVRAREQTLKKSRQRDILFLSLLVILCLILFFFLLGNRPLWDVDEGMHAATSKDMILSGDWITPQFNGENFYDKPVLFNWLAAISFLIFGFTEFAARLPAAILGTGCVLVTYFLGKRMFSPTVGISGWRDTGNQHGIYCPFKGRGSRHRPDIFHDPCADLFLPGICRQIPSKIGMAPFLCVPRVCRSVEGAHRGAASRVSSSSFFS